MRRFAILVGVLFAAACDKPAPAPAAAGTMSAALKLADFAGKWAMETRGDTGTAVLVAYTLDAKADTAGWALNFPDRAPVPTHVSVSGDSLIMDAGPYESVLRKGVQVTTHSVSRLKDGKIEGTTVAHYSNTPTADSVRMLRMSGTKMP